MSFLDNILGGGQQQQDYQNFVHRYDQGAPSEGYSDNEVMQRYQQVVPNLQPQQFMQAAEGAFSRMSPQERAQLGQMLIGQAQQQGVNVPSLGGGGSYEDPRQLAQMATQVHQQQPGLLGQLLGGIGGGGGGGIGGGGGGAGQILSNPVAKAALAGIAAMAVKQFMQQRH
ncbi:MAG TPA: hypothetical protein VLJ14_19220 [Ktedonobacterales bacterium]|jgi:hypothetical protein|nr:hypothetical protein [Ktedonobacterales bacterium]